MGKYKLEPDENLMEFAARRGVSVTEIWEHANNAGLKRRVGNPWLVGSGETVWVPDECSSRIVAISGRLHEFILKPPPDIIDVYLGFMDEEVNALLAELIKAENDKGEKARPVILVERGQLSKDKPILEWRIGNYPVNGKDSPIRKIIHVSPQGMRDAAKDAKTSPDRASPKPPPEIPSPPPIYGSVSDNAWSRRYTEWKERRDRAVSKTPTEDIVLYELEVVRATKRGAGETLSEAPPEPPPAVKKKAKHGKWIGDFEKWKKDMREFAAKWPKVRSEWKKEKKSWDKKTESIAPEDILANAMLIYMDQSVGEDKKLKDKGITFRRAFDLFELIQHRGHPKTKSRLPETVSGAGPWLSVVRFDVGPDTYTAADKIRAPIVVMRTPEMGLQPSLMRPYTGFLLKAISLLAAQLAAEKAEMSGEIDREATRQTEGKAPRWDIWDWPLRITQYGAQGSSSLLEQFRPGKVVHVIASLFVGVDIDRAGRTWSLISLCTPAGIYDFYRKEVTGEESKKDRMVKAQDDAQRIYRENWADLKLTGDLIFFDSNSPYAEVEKDKLTPGMTLKDAINATIEIYKDKVYKTRKYPAIVTLTVSYFGSELDKKAADNIGIKGVNMEDYHVLRVVRDALCQGISETTDYPIVLGGRVDRIQCDPKKIEKDVEEAFLTHIYETDPGKEPHTLLTVADYADIIIWGLKGLLTKEMPPCVRWDFIDHYWNLKGKKGEKWQDLIKTHFWSFTGQEDFIVPNPFCIEMATDLLSELKEMKPGIAGLAEERKGKLRGMAKAVQSSWNRDEKEGVRAVPKPARNGLPQDVREKEYVGPKGTATRALAIDLMYEVAKNCGFAILQDGSYRLKGVGKLKPEEVGPEDRGKIIMKTWLRPGKWGPAANPIKAPATQDLKNPDFSDPKFDAECVDRAFYKSCNMMALQTMAWSVFREK